MTSPRARRLESIDLLRGVVMVVMALDHVRNMLMTPRPEGMSFAEATVPLFFTRWITHFCAPTFILLAGTSAFLWGQGGRTLGDVSRFLATRGAWLVVVELTVVNFAWNFNLGPRFMPILQVIWAIGMSMIALAGLIWLPRRMLAGFAVAMIAGHNLLDAVQPATSDASPVWMLLHLPGALVVGGTPVAFVGYPLIPWVGVMALGWVIGPIFAGADPERPRRLVRAGGLLLVAFVALRLIGVYGDPNAWHLRDTVAATLVDVLDTTKYPPSLQYLLMTLGPAVMLLGVFERARGAVAGTLVVVGRVPFFFYVVHLYLIHGVALAIGAAQGFAAHEVAVAFPFYPAEFGVGLGATYVLWIVVVAALYPACRWFAGVKARRGEWWLSYL